MKKIFLDVGAWKGTVTQFFINIVPDSKEYEFHLFEPHPQLLEKYLYKLPEIKTHNINFHPYAAWSSEKQIDFYIGKKKYSRSNSLISTKETGNLDIENPIKIRTLDFNSFIKSNFTKDDFIICKMNIEGAEYEILPHMFSNGSVNYIKKLYVSWHYKKINYSEEMHNHLIEHIKSETQLFGWDIDENDDSSLINEHNVKWFNETLQK